MVLRKVSSCESKLLFQTYRDAIVPESDVVLLPLKTNVKFLRCGDDFIQISNDGVALGLRHAHDLGDEARVEEKRLPASHRMGTYKRMLCSDGVTTNSAPSRF